VLGLATLLSACGPNPNGLGVADFGTVTGRVVDAKTLAAVPQFTASAGGQSVNIAPGAKGAFTLDHVPTGTQTVTIYAIGYQTYTLPGVIVQKNQPTVIEQPIGIVSSTGN